MKGRIAFLSYYNRVWADAGDLVALLARAGHTDIAEQINQAADGHKEEAKAMSKKPYTVTADVTLSSINSLAAEVDLRVLLSELRDAGQIETFSVTHCEPGEGNEGA